jgi:hypothetical protein
MEAPSETGGLVQSHRRAPSRDHRDEENGPCNLFVYGMRMWLVCHRVGVLTHYQIRGKPKAGSLAGKSLVAIHPEQCCMPTECHCHIHGNGSCRVP